MSKQPQISRSTYLPVRLLLLVALLALSIPSNAQGCTQCRDNTAATPPQTQAAYRHAIELMVATAGSIFLATVFLLKKPR
ncbi:copper resistance protein CopC [Granulicella arctica]|uniref:Uncharacterized protein n=1 Tax=Granulicella arctica TaxID=940613 RepID=A0A7Y9PKA7_9BACT|nr:copper resistance protein CopC [Granulicella arctica]NYF80658.1 hypothetical protein [Granulicella arctica]